MISRRIAVGLIVGITVSTLVPQQGWAQVFPRPFQPAKAIITELSADGRRQWERSERLAADGQHAEAVDALRDVLDRHAAELILVNTYREQQESWERYLPADSAAQERLLAWQGTKPEVMRIYRSLVEREAEQLFVEAKKQRNSVRLEALLRSHRACEIGPEILIAAGDLLLAAGDFAAARARFSQLHPLAAAVQENRLQGAGRELWEPFRGKKFKDVWPTLQPRIVEATAGGVPSASHPKMAGEMLARLALVSFLEGENERGEIELEILRQLAPQAEGFLAGKKGRYIDTLTQLSRTVRRPSANESLITFAANATRNGVAPAGAVQFASQPKWQLDLPAIATAADVLSTGRKRIADDDTHTLAYFPLVVGDRVFLRYDRDGNSIVAAHDLADGRELWRFVHPLPTTEENGTAPVNVGLPRHMLSFFDNALFARVGNPMTAPASRKVERIQTKDQGSLVGLDVTSEGRPLEAFPQYPAEHESAFEGTPLVDEGYIYTAMTKRVGNRRQCSIACFERLTTPVDTTQGSRDGLYRGRLVWRTLVATADTVGSGELDEVSQQLISRNENLLFVCTNLGAVAAVDVADGRIHWLVRYPRTSLGTDAKPAEGWCQRDSTPPVVHRGRVVFAPSDSAKVFALHSATGLPAWLGAEASMPDVVQLLGASGDSVIAVGESLVWLDLFTGEIQKTFPANKSAKISSFGRGYLTADHIYWPTREAIYVLPTDFQAKTGPTKIDLQGAGIPSGNLIPSPAGLLIAGNRRLTYLTAVVPASKLEKKPQ